MRWLALAVLLFAATPAAAAEPQVVDRIVAVVGRDPILLSDLAARADPLALQARAQAKSKVEASEARTRVYREMLAAMIDERLIAQYAETKQIRVDATEVDTALERIAQANSMTRSELLEAAAEQMGSAEAYAAAIEQQIRKFKVLRLEVDNVPADESEMDALMVRTEKSLVKRLRRELFWSVGVTFE